MPDASPTFGPFARFGIDAPLCQHVLREATAHGADDAELFFDYASATSVGLSDRKVNRAHFSVDLGVGIRVVRGDQVGYSYTENLDPESLIRAAQIAARIARQPGSVPLPVAVPTDFRPVPTGDHYPTERLWSDVELEERLPLVRAWEDRAFSHDPRVIKVNVSLSDADRWVLIATADGRIALDHRPSTSASVGCTLVEGAERETGSYNLSARADLRFYTPERQQRLAEVPVQRAIQALRSSSPPAGEMPVVLAAGSSGILLHEAIGHGMEADFNRKGTSIYADRMHQRVAPDEVTIIDDATLPGARGSLNVDDEGSPTERTVLVENGFLRSYLHDRLSARHYGVASTGSGRRASFRDPVLPRMRSTYMQAGPHDPAEIIASVQNGLYCETFSNGQVQIGAGDFSFYVRLGWRIENGRLTEPVKDVNLIGHGPTVLATIDRVGNDLVVDEGGWTCGKDGQSVPVSQGMPTVRVARLSVGGGRS